MSRGSSPSSSSQDEDEKLNLGSKLEKLCFVNLEGEKKVTGIGGLTLLATFGLGMAGEEASMIKIWRVFAEKNELSKAFGRGRGGLELRGKGERGELIG